MTNPGIIHIGNTCMGICDNSMYDELMANGF